jgi:tRNA (guanine37-N1)-methyltransferase
MSTAADTTDTVFSAPSDPSFFHPAPDFPPLSIFEQSIEHPALLVPARRTAELRKQLTHVVLHRPQTKSVYPVDEDSSLRKLVLKQDAKVYDDHVVQKLLKDNTCQKSSHTLTLTYKDWTVDQVLKKLLPSISEVPSAFETVGHIAHVNLRNDVFPFKYIVGKVILDKNAPRIQTVVNKIGSIETEYRTFGMEVIAGNDKEGWSIVNLKEEGCQYDLDFRQVYWNSRLAGEHRRLVQVITREQQQQPSSQQQMVVADLMAGVGPFAVPLTAHSNQNIVVHANDLNPSSHKYLVMNGKKNKCDNLHCYQMDGRAFVRELCDRGIEISHAIMNLPASAPEFLDAFIGYTGKQLPRIHVHCFGSKQAEAEEEAIQRCAKALNCPLDREKDRVSVHIVRDVAPNKNMLCVSFTLPVKVREQPRMDTWSTTTPDAPPTKRIKL